MDRRRHPRFAVRGRADVHILRDVDIESTSTSAVVVLASTPAAAGTDAIVRVTRAGDGPLSMRVRTSHCHPVLVDGYRRYRVTYAVLGPDDRVHA